MSNQQRTPGTKCKYIVAYTSAVTGNRIWSGCGSKQQADIEAARLFNESAKNVSVHKFGRPQ